MRLVIVSGSAGRDLKGVLGQVFYSKLGSFARQCGKCR
jgi:hypothetical protein